MKFKKLLRKSVYRAGFILLLTVILSLVVCSSGRGAVGGLTYSPGGNGFGYKSVSVPQGDFKKWASKNRSKIKDALGALEKGYVLEVVGHSDSSGPRNAVGNKRGNLWYSRQRAASVYRALIAQGFRGSKLRYKGLADDELLDSSDERGAINRRVTFRVVKK